MPKLRCIALSVGIALAVLQACLPTAAAQPRLEAVDSVVGQPLAGGGPAEPLLTQVTDLVESLASQPQPPPGDGSSAPESSAPEQPGSSSAPRRRDTSRPPSGSPSPRGDQISGLERTGRASAERPPRAPRSSRRGSARAARPGLEGSDARRRGPPRSTGTAGNGIADAVLRPVRDLVESVPASIKAALAALAVLSLLLAVVALLYRRGLGSAQLRARTDALTGLPNRGYLEDTLDRMVAHARRREVPLAAVMFDVDHFKRVNDECGHRTGDEVLSAIARLVGPELRASDFAGRYGGEEFLLLLPDTDVAGAATVAEKLREAIGRLRVTGLGAEVTASLGVAALAPGTGGGHDLVEAADQALYRAKDNGRNRVETASPRVVALPVV